MWKRRLSEGLGWFLYLWSKLWDRPKTEKNIQKKIQLSTFIFFCSSSWFVDIHIPRLVMKNSFCNSCGVVDCPRDQNWVHEREDFWEDGQYWKQIKSLISKLSFPLFTYLSHLSSCGFSYSETYLKRLHVDKCLEILR